MASGPAIRRRRTFRCLVPRGPRAHRGSAPPGCRPRSPRDVRTDRCRLFASFSSCACASSLGDRRPALHRQPNHPACSRSCQRGRRPSAPPGYVRIRGSHRSQLLRSLKQELRPHPLVTTQLLRSPLAAFLSHPQARRRRTQRQRWAVHQKVPPELRSRAVQP